MAKCIGHIFNGRVGGDWRCERCGMAYADRLKELDGGVSGQSGFGRICHDPAAKQSPKLNRGSPMTDEMLVAELRALGDWVYGDLLAAAADRLSSLEEEKRVRSWQPIETAPKDGNEFLAYCPEMSLFQVVDYDPSEDHPDWVWAVSDGVKYHKTAFTHWMPLPEPPVLSAGVGPLHTPMMENR